jgi:hypothetical protein
MSFHSDVDKVLEIANNIYEKIYENSNILTEMLNIDCTNYFIDNYEKIDIIKNNFINKIKFYFNYIKNIEYEYLNYSHLAQLIEILTNNDLEIFKLKNMYTKNINEYLSNTEKEMYINIYNMIDDNTLIKIKYYINIDVDETIKSIINNFLSKIEYIKNNNIYFLFDDNIDNTDNIDNIKSENLENIENIEKLENIDNIEEIVKSVSDKYELIYNNLSELKYTLWNENVILYEIRGKTKYIYIYIDLYKRKDKNEQLDIIKLDNFDKKYCINFNYENNFDKNNFDKNKFINILENIVRKII